MLVASGVSNSATPWTVAHQAPLPMGFSRQDYLRVGNHCLLQGIFLIQGLNSGLLYCRQILYHLPPRKAQEVTNTALLVNSEWPWQRRRDKPSQVSLTHSFNDYDGWVDG